MYGKRHNEKAYDYLFALFTTVFVTLKYHDLFLPYFWDELGVYSRAALYLAQNKLSLFPSALPPELSRGHPLLFSYLFGIAYRLFGYEVTSGHILSLFITIVLLLVVYRKTALHFNKLTGLGAIVILTVQPVFYAQSTMVLPEMLLSLLVFVSLILYYEKKMWHFAFFSSAAILVKESAIVLPATVIAYSIINRIIVKEKDDRLSIQSISLSLIPLIVFGLFLIVQKVENGWFFFPLHIGFVSFNPETILKSNHNYQNFLFFHQGRYWWVKVFLAAGLLLLLKGKVKWSDRLVTLFVLFGLIFLAFCSINFYMDRYTLPLFPIITILLAASLYSIYTNKWFNIIAFTALAILSFKDMDTGYFNYDCDMGFKHHLSVEQQTLSYVEKIASKEDTLIANFPLNFVIDGQYTGFNFHNLKSKPLEKHKTLYITTSNTEVYLPNYNSLKLLQKFNESYAEGCVFEKIK